MAAKIKKKINDHGDVIFSEFEGSGGVVISVFLLADFLAFKPSSVDLNLAHKHKNTNTGNEQK